MGILIGLKVLRERVLGREIAVFDMFLV